MLALLCQRNFALLWWGGLISLTGSRVLSVALPFYIYTQTGSALATAIMILVNILPVFLLGPVVGVLVDRWNRRRTMIAANVARAVILLPLLLVDSSERLWIIYIVAAVEAAISTFFIPAENALLPNLVSQDHLLSANSLNALNNNLARLIGPPIGGLLLGTFGLGSVVLVDSVSCLIAGLLLVRLTVPPKARNETTGDAPFARALSESVWTQWRAGLRLVGSDQLVALLFVVVGVITCGGTMMDPLIAPFVHDIVQAGALGFGWMLTAQGLGGIIGGMIAGQFGKLLQPSQLLSWSCIATGAMLLAMFNLPYLPVILALSFLIGVASVGTGASLQTLLQSNVLDAYRGRVFGALSMISASLELISVGAAGMLGDVVGIVPLLNVAAVITIGAGVLAFAVLPHQRLWIDNVEARRRT